MTLETSRWDGHIHFIHDTNHPDKVLTGKEMELVVISSEIISNVQIYTISLNEHQTLFHFFIIFQTKKWFWSIDNVGSEVWIQRSTDIDDVKCKFKNKERLGLRSSIFQGIDLLGMLSETKCSIMDLYGYINRFELKDNRSNLNDHHEILLEFSWKVFKFICLYNPLNNILKNKNAKKEGENLYSHIHFIQDTNQPDQVLTGKEMERLVISSEIIIYIQKYKIELIELLTFYHFYIIFQTRRWFWSIDKIGSEVWIQRSIKREDVQLKFKNEERPGLTNNERPKSFQRPILPRNDKSKTKCSVKDLCRFLNRNKLNDNENFKNLSDLDSRKSFSLEVFKFICSHDSSTNISKIDNADSMARKTGGIWDSQIHFIDDTSHSDEILTGKEMSKVINLFELIDHIWMYKSPLSRWQITSFLFFHVYLILKTEKFYWSIEKNGSGVWIQKSDCEENVKLKFRNKYRNGVANIESIFQSISLLSECSNTKCSVQDLKAYINQNELNNIYFYILDIRNCKGFAQRIYDFICSHHSKTYHLKNKSPLEMTEHGSYWNGQIHFINDPKKPAEVLNWIVMEEVIDALEIIDRVWMYTIAINKRQYAVIRTKHWHWLIQQIGSEMWIQKSRCVEDIKLKITNDVRYMGNCSTFQGEIVWSEESTSKSIKDFINYVNKNEFDEETFSRKMHEFICSLIS